MLPLLWRRVYTNLNINPRSYVDLKMSLIKRLNYFYELQCQRKALRSRIYICRQYYTMAAHAEAPLHEESSS
jgi:hypothetical protein